MVKINKIKGRIVENEMSVEEVAALMKIDKSSLYRKFQNPESITVKEANLLREILNFTPEEASDIFLNSLSHGVQQS